MDPIIYGREFPLRKIVSGGQTGVDRAALDAAIFLDIEHGGWCPRGRRSEDGPIDLVYNLIETNESDYQSKYIVTNIATSPTDWREDSSIIATISVLRLDEDNAR